MAKHATRKAAASKAAAKKQSKPAVSSAAAGESSAVTSDSSRNEAQSAAKKSNRRKLTKIDVQNALKALEQRESQPLPPDSEGEMEPVVVCSDVSQSEVLRFRELHEKLGFRIRFHPTGEYSEDADPDQIIGDLIATELLRSPHETAGGFINGIKDSIYMRYSDRSLEITNSPTCTIPGEGIKEPDGSLTPEVLPFGPTVFDLGDGNPFPTCVWEISYYESLKRLKAELAAWISAFTSVMVAIGVKIFGPGVDGKRRMLALVYRRGVADPEQAVEFGTTVPTAAGLQLVIQVADLYHVAARPPGYAAGDTVTIDLAVLQARILSKIH